MSPRSVLRSPYSRALSAGCLSGVLCFLSFPPADFGLLAFVALVPLALVFRHVGGRHMALASLAFSVSLFGPLISWVRLFGSIAYVGLVLAMTLWIVAALGAGQYVKAPLLKSKYPWLAAAAFPISFFAGEYLRSHYPLGGFGWGGMGYTQHDNQILLKLAPFTGVWGISFLILVFNSLLAEALVRLQKIPATAGLVAGALALAVAPAALPTGQPDGRKARIAMVQGNVPENSFDPKSDDHVVLENNLELTRKIRPGDSSLVVWPEGSFDRDPSKDDRLGEPLLEIVRQTRTPFLVGAISHTDLSRGLVQNSSLFLTPDGSIAGVYAKQHPVPFGEWIPFRKVLAPRIKALDRIPYDQVPGTESTVFSLPEGKFASVICYESTYPALVRSFVRNGARLLVVSTNDSSFERSAASEQHLIFSQLRAAEHRMWVAHTAISGISAVIDPRGNILQRSQLFEQELFIPEMRFATETTAYAKAGDWVPALLLAFLLVLMVWASLARSKNGKVDSTPLLLDGEATPDSNKDRLSDQETATAGRAPV